MHNNFLILRGAAEPTRRSRDNLCSTNETALRLLTPSFLILFAMVFEVAWQRGNHALPHTARRSRANEAEPRQSRPLLPSPTNRRSDATDAYVLAYCEAQPRQPKLRWCTFICLRRRGDAETLCCPRTRFTRTQFDCCVDCSTFHRPILVLPPVPRISFPTLNSN